MLLFALTLMVDTLIFSANKKQKQTNPQQKHIQTQKSKTEQNIEKVCFKVRFFKKCHLGTAVPGWLMSIHSCN